MTRVVSRGARSRSLSLCGAALCLFAVALAPSTSHAQGWKPKPAAGQPSQEQIDDARKRYDKGIHLYEVEGDVQSALVELQRAYDIAPNYIILYNIGQVARTARDYVIALRAFEAYLSMGGTSVPSDKREQVLAEVKTLKGLVGAIRVTTTATEGTVSIDGAEVGALPLGDSINVNPGSHRVELRSGGRTASKSVSIAGGDAQSVELVLDASGPSGPVEPPKVEAKASMAWVGWVISGVLGAGAIGTGVAALAIKGDLDETPYVGAQPTDDVESKRSTVTALAVTTDVLIGAAVLGGGISLYFTIRDANAGSKKEGEPPKPATAVRVTPNGVVVFGTY